MQRFASLIRKNSNDTQQQAPPRSMSPADLDDARFIPTPYATHSRRATVAAMPVDPLVELERELAATSIRRSASHSQALPPAPPSYTTAVRDAASSTDAAPRRASSSRSTARAPLPSLPPQAIAEDPATENVLRALARYDIVFLVDDSGSMVPLWKQARDALIGVVNASIAYDKDGIDVCFLNSERQLAGCTSASAIRTLFDEVRPRGSTPTAFRVDDILRPYIEQVEDSKAARIGLPKPMVLQIISDGRADDEDTLKDVIVEMASRLDANRAPPFQLGIQFVQIGSDPDVTQFLRDLDDNLKEEHGIRDIVDTVEYRGALASDFIIQACLGAINRRIDPQSHCRNLRESSVA